MHDIKSIRENPQDFDEALSHRGIYEMSAKILSLDEERRSAILAAETATAQQNKAAKEISKAKSSNDENAFKMLRDLVSSKKKRGRFKKRKGKRTRPGIDRFINDYS
jgi:seryl-tRNA synthetase